MRKQSSENVNYINRAKVAFTLAETLITLGIIGIVAAITIPALIQNFQDHSTLAQLKKTYSLLSSAYSRAVEVSGNTPQAWFPTSDNSQTMINMIKPHLNIIKDCNASGSGQGCFKAGEYYKLINGFNYGILDNGGHSIVLADGTIILAELYWPACNQVRGSSLSLRNTCGSYIVDLNGIKGPNTVGKDAFWFWLTKYGIVPMGDKNASVWSFNSGCINTSGDYIFGYSCTAWAVYNQNLDYLHCPMTLKNGWTGPMKCN